MSFLASPFLRWGIAAAIIVALFFLWRGAEKGEAAARLEATLHAEDAARWRDDALASRGMIDGLNSRIEAQNAANDRIYAAKKRADGFAVSAALEAQRAQESLSALIQRTETHALEHPEDDRPLLPGACAVYRSLYGAAAACTDPAGAPAP